MQMTGQPILAARSITLQIFSLITSPREPPKTVKSCEKTQTRRPSIVPWPVTTASPHGRDLSIWKSCVRWRTYVSSSWKVPGSSSFSIRSRAVYLPFACCFSTAFSDAWWIAASRSSCSWASFSWLVSRAFSRMGRAVYARVSGGAGGRRLDLGMRDELATDGNRRPRPCRLARERAVVRGAERVERAREHRRSRGGLDRRQRLRRGRLGDRLRLGLRLRLGRPAPEHPPPEPRPRRLGLRFWLGIGLGRGSWRRRVDHHRQRRQRHLRAPA